MQPPVPRTNTTRNVPPPSPLPKPRDYQPPAMTMDDFTHWVKLHDAQWGYKFELTPECLLEATLGFVCEAGELGDNVKKYVRAQWGDNVARWGDLDHLKHEVALEAVDTIIYLSKVLGILGISEDILQEAWYEKFRILHERWPTDEKCTLCKEASHASSDNVNVR